MNPDATPDHKPSVSLIVMTLDEIDGMKVIMPQIDRSCLDQIIVVDGGSTDGTIEYARDNNFEVYVQKEPGPRQAYHEVWPLIRGDWVILFSPDGNSLPEIIPDLIKKMEKGYDMVIASRYIDGAESADDGILTSFGNWLFTRTVNLLHGGQYTDAMVIYRIFRKEMIQELDLDRDDAFALPEKLFRTRISWEPLLSVRAAKRRLKIGEIPGDEPPRIGGVQKMQPFKWGGAYFFQFIRECWFWKP